MKTMLTLFTVLLSTSVFAEDLCTYRFNSKLAVDVTVADRTGIISWDNANFCSEDSCTEIYPGAFKVLWKDLTPPDTQGAVKFKVRSINTHDDLGNRYNRNSKFGRFIREARFTSYVIPQPNLMIHWNGKDYKMVCTRK